MAYEKGTLTVENKQVIFIKPSQPTPTTILSLSTIDNIPENELFVQVLNVYAPPTHDSANTTKPDPLHVIKEALSNVLSYYYPLAGRVVRHADGKFRVKCKSGSHGVPFIEAICNSKLSSLNYLLGSHYAKSIHFARDFPTHDEFGDQYPIVTKMTKFLCGSTIISFRCLHSICDGIGVSKFSHALAELANGKAEPSLKPVWERERLVGTITSHPMKVPINEDFASTSPFLPSKDFTHVCSVVDGESIARLKTSLMKEIGDKSNEERTTEKKGFSTFECLAACVWRSRARALKMKPHGETMLVIAVGMRSHLLDPLPDGYYGNGIVEAYVVLTVRELNEKPLREVVKLIKESKRVAFTNEYIQHYINSIETKPMKYNYNTGAVMALTDWRYLERPDFGWKVPVNTIPGPCNTLFGVSAILPPSNLDRNSTDGGVRVYMPLPRAAMPKFEQEMEALGGVENV